MFNSSKNIVVTIKDGQEDELDSPEAYVAYSKSNTVIVSDSRRIPEMCLHT